MISEWGKNLIEIEEYRKRREMFDEAVRASELFFREGYPSCWSIENVKEIGLENQGYLNWTKLTLLKDMGYSKFQSLTNFKYFVNVSIKDMQNETIFEFGPNVSFEPKEIVKIVRFSILNQTMVRIEVKVWKL